MDRLQTLFDTIESLVMCHSPSGVETEVDRWLRDRCAALGIDVTQDGAGNLILHRPSAIANAPRVAITAHKDEIGAIVHSLESNGRVQIRRLGGSYPWVYGEGAIDLLGDRETVTGILSFGSRHVSHESPQKRLQENEVVRWETAWVETKRSPEDLVAAGIRPGTRAVVGKHRKRPLRLGDWIASYTLDNKASIAILLAVAEQVIDPAVDLYLVASAKEEVGAIGALHFALRHPLDALIALEICPLAPEYPIIDGPIPVLLAQDGYGLYDEGLNAAIRAAADRADIPLQLLSISQGFGSDGSIAMKFGHVPRAACLAFPTENTHGYEIAHLGAIAHCIDVLVALVREPMEWAV